MTKKKNTTASLFTRVKTIKDVQARIELGRAHLIITVLSFALLLTLIFNLHPEFTPDPALTYAAAILLLLVGLFSFFVSAYLYTSKRK